MDWFHCADSCIKHSVPTQKKVCPAVKQIRGFSKNHGRQASVEVRVGPEMATVIIVVDAVIAIMLLCLHVVASVFVRIDIDILCMGMWGVGDT